MSQAELPAALDNTLMIPRRGLHHAAIASYGYKLQRLRIQVRQIARERDKARLDLEEVERRCLHLVRELDEQYIALEHTQSKLRDVQAETEAKELLLQQAVNHQAKLEADTQFLHSKKVSLQGRLNHTMKENTQLQNKVMEMAEKLAASKKLVLELQKELNCVVKDKLGQMEPHSLELLNQSERFAEIVLEYEQQCQSENSKEEVSHLDKMHQLSHELTEHAACWMETELLRQQLKASQEKEEHEHLLQAAVEQAEGLENNLRSAEAVLAERAAQLKDAQAQLSRNKLLIKDLREENRGFAMALQAAELKQKSTEEKNQLLKEQASALKQLIRKITPASLSG